MDKEEKLLRESIEISDKTIEKLFYQWLSSLGYDKCLEIYKNYVLLTNETGKVSLFSLLQLTQYCYDLSSILFSLLRQEEDYIKAFLCNTFNNYKVRIESRHSNYVKTKYYFKIPTNMKESEFIDIRTFSYTYGPIEYYDAIKTLDFGDINLIMSHLSKSIISKFSSNPKIIKDLDRTRQLRNYVYHHNLLFSMGKDNLLDDIIMVIKNLPNENSKRYYISTINALRYKGSNRSEDIGSSIAIFIDSEKEKEIFN